MVEVSEWHAPGTRNGAIAFSHGADSAPWHYAPVIDAWVAHGYDVFAPLHVDSKEHPLRAHYPGLASWHARLEDMRVVAASIPGRHYVAAGHSYGGLVALTLGGAEPTPPADFPGPMRDPRVRAVVAFSPPGPLRGFVDRDGYSHLAVPALIQTGDRDNPDATMGSGAPDSWQLHLAAFDAASVGGQRYALVLPGVDHYFGGLICDPARTGPPQHDQLREAVRISELFMDATAGNAAARHALDAREGTQAGGELRRR
jgi:pimeloyl-ACP methyl ester carboxylesterase